MLLALSLTACKYSNTFEGTYNGNAAKMTAYSKNINRYCISLSLTAGSETKQAFISASDVFDSSDLLKPKAFNSKGTNCSANQDDYMSGVRKTNVLGTSLVTYQNSVNSNYCQQVTYNRYLYKEEISFEFKKNANDEITGKFEGIGEESYYVDRDHPVAYGPIYYCGGSYPYPYPGPGYPYPYPYPGPGYPYPYPY